VYADQRDHEPRGRCHPAKCFDPRCRFKDEGAGRRAIPVCDGQKLAGLATDRDITVRAVAEGRDPSEVRVTEVMSSDIAYCFGDETVEQAAKLMEAKQIRRLPVLDGNKQLAGIISLGDIFGARRRLSSERYGRRRA
jgi:CBS domain-containing protein